MGVLISSLKEKVSASRTAARQRGQGKAGKPLVAFSFLNGSGLLMILVGLSYESVEI